ncbi:MAG: hypothetical protein KBB11_07910 [Bacteroidales bacterium]|nr:hypothetical protein [Bacteroidales bacterium]HQP04735.1 hypothetical protein [Bacteroidales bacterium]
MKNFIIILAISFSVIPQTSFSQNNPEDILDVFFDTFKTDMNKAIDYLFSTNELIAPNQEGIKSIKERLEVSRKLLGNYYGQELISLEKAGDSYLRYTYMLRYDRQPVKIIIVMYRPDTKWKVQNLNFEDKMDDSFSLIE